MVKAKKHPKKTKKISKKVTLKKIPEKVYQDFPERTPPSREEIECKFCKFKATYKFRRCPSCDKVQE